MLSFVMYSSGPPSTLVPNVSHRTSDQHVTSAFKKRSKFYHILPCSVSGHFLHLKAGTELGYTANYLWKFSAFPEKPFVKTVTG